MTEIHNIERHSIERFPNLLENKMYFKQFPKGAILDERVYTIILAMDVQSGVLECENIPSGTRSLDTVNFFSRGTQKSPTINKFPTQRNLRNQITQFPLFPSRGIHTRCSKSVALPSARGSPFRGLITFKNVTSGIPLSEETTARAKNIPRGHVSLEIFFFHSFQRRQWRRRRWRRSSAGKAGTMRFIYPKREVTLVKRYYHVVGRTD